MKKIAIISTRGAAKIIETNAANWEELQRELSANKIEYKGMNAIISETGGGLVNNQSLLLNSDQTIYLVPQKTKSGMAKTAASKIDRKAILSQVKGFITNDSKAKEFFNKDTNYTRKTSEDLVDLVAKWEKKANTKSTSNKVSDNVKTAVANTVKAVKDSKESKEKQSDSDNKSNETMNDNDKVAYISKLLKSIENPSLKARAEACNTQVEDMAYILEFGSPRIENLGKKLTIFEKSNWG